MVELQRLKELFKLSSIYSVGGFVVKGLSFLLYPLYTTVLSPAQFGIIGIAAFVVQGSRNLFTSGTQAAAFNFYHRYDERGRNEFYSSLVIFSLCLTVILLALFDLAGPWFFEKLLNRDIYDPYLRIAVITAAIVAIFHIIPKQRFKAQEQAKWFSLMDIGRGAVNHVVTLVALFGFSLGALGYLYGGLAGAGVVGIFGAVVLVREFSVTFSVEKIIDALKYSLPLFPHYYSHFLISMADRVLLARLGSLGNVGLYTVGYAMAAALQMVVTSGNNAMMPEFSKASDEDESFSRLPGITTYYLLVCGFATVGFAAFMPVAITHLFSADYSAATSILPWLALAFFANAIYYAPMNVLAQTARETRAIPVMTLGAALVNIGVNFLLIPLYGIVGAAISTLLAYLFLAISIYLLSRRVVSVEYEYRRVTVAVVATVFGVSMTGFLPGAGILLETTLAVVPLAIFGVVLTALGFWSEEEISFVRQRL